jgi:hypothetical protein
MCAHCKALFTALRVQQRYCNVGCRSKAHHRRVSVRRPSTAERGYNKAHRRERELWASIVESGKASCARCAQPIDPGSVWDLGHTEDRTTWSGPEHARCNRSTAARHGNERRTFDTDIRARDRTCPLCGDSYRASYRDQRTCSRACGAELRRRSRPVRAVPSRPLRTVACSECAALFRARSSQAKTCNAACGAIRQRRLLNERYRNDPEFRDRVRAAALARARLLCPPRPAETRSCAHCGAEYTVVRTNQAYCSHRCNKAAYKRRLRRRTHDAAA